jgi:GT2 family glycosyltransferase
VAPTPSDADDGTSSVFADRPDVSVVVVAYGREEWLGRSVRSILASEGVRVDVVIVDNGGTGDTLDELIDLDGVEVVRPTTNIGFAAGCNLGVARSAAPFVALVNPDAIVEPAALAELVRVADKPHVGLATASVRLSDNPDRLNSGGNVVHFSGLSWSGWFDEPASDHPDERPVASASGAALACRRVVWDELGGFSDEFFAYCEDADLSLRAWQRGLEVIYVPTAVVVHRYEFSRNPLKFRLLERNRAVMTLTCFGRRHLLVIAPVLVALELATFLLALRYGWAREKLAAYRWLYHHRRWLRERRTLVQSQRRVPYRELAMLFDDHLRPANIDLPRAVGPFERLLARYWRLVRPYVAREP